MRDTVAPALRLEGVTLASGGRDLLRAIEFSLAPGTLTVLLGANGAGKSLLLKLCHGLLRPTSGRILWPSGMTHQFSLQRPVFLRRSAYANITHALRLAGSPRRVAGFRAKRALVRFGLKRFARHPARRLSGGEQQKLAIARAWAAAPGVLLLDEPTASLDLKATAELERLVRSLAADGVTILMSTHDIAQARRLADRVLFLMDGALVENSPASAFFRRPSSTQARQFLAGDIIEGNDT
ncbi:MAG TPA: ATP-binding cassette domain-containing protein [Aestuariivirgaceae bacterium]|nr:ATP-binding cassette domain-containing protein [Aestuariivirgaceae bacterium]